MKLIRITRENYRRFAPYLIVPEGKESPVLLGALNSQDEVLGTAAYVLSEGRAELSFLYVCPPFRRKGVGSLLLIRGRALLGGEKALPVTVDFSDRNEGMKAFLEKAGFFICPGNRWYEFALKDSLGLLNRRKDDPGGKILSLAEMDREEKKALARHLDELGWSGGLLEDRFVIDELSVAAVTEGKTYGFMIVVREDERTIRIERLAVSEGSRGLFTVLVKNALLRMCKMLTSETIIRFFGENEKLVDAAQRLLGDALRPAEQYFTAVG